MKFSATLLSVVLLATSGLGATTKRCRPRVKSTAAASVSTTIIASVPTSVVLSTTDAVSSSISTSIVQVTTSATTHPDTTTSKSRMTTSRVTSSSKSSSSTHAPTTTASPTTHTTTAPAASTPPASNNSGTKRGLSYNDVNLLKGFGSGKASWAYNWASVPGGTIPKGLNFFPMLWGGSSSFTNDWAKNAQAAIDSGSTHLLFLNEPDLGSQSNTDPATAAQLWMKFMQPFAGKATLVSPAVTNGPPPAMGTGWLDSFFSECAKLGCTVDAVAAHIYADASDASYFKSYISGLSKYGKPVLMTEVGTSGGSAQEQQALVDELVPFLDGLSTVSHYAWFMAGQGILVNGDGSLTALGQAYQSA